MPSEGVATILRLVGWGTIPDRLTSFLVPRYYKYILRRPEGPPPIGTIQYATTYRWTYAIVILSYLIFNLLQAAWSQKPNFYQLLNVGIDADEGQLKAAFRKFARRNHPDKVGVAGEGMFMVVRDAYEALKDPAKRFAYERFGPDALTWEKVITHKEYMNSGLTHAAGFYVGTFFMMLVWAVLGNSDSGTIWRFLLFFYVLFAELALCVEPALTSPLAATSTMFPLRSTLFVLPLPLHLLRSVFPHWATFQHVSFLHQLYVALSIAIARVGPVVWPDSGNAGAMDVKEEMAWKGVVQKLVQLTANADNEVGRILQTELTSIQGVERPEPRPAGGVGPFPDEETVRMLESEMELLGIDAQVLNNPTLRAMWLEAIVRRRQDEQLARTGLRSPPLEAMGGDRVEEETMTIVGGSPKADTDGIALPSSPPSPSRQMRRLASPPGSPIVPLSPTLLLQNRSLSVEPSDDDDGVMVVGGQVPRSPGGLARPDLSVVAGSSSSSPDAWVKAISVEGGTM
ncbi:hypothetical protein FRB95_006336 [Tulasnella sp. JGI-2019a]|nr:hypothetical protein FRB95_006336 [Tulasnella sp. JGI-2019a]